MEEVAKAVGGGYCRLQMPLKLTPGVRATVRRLAALEGAVPRPFQRCLGPHHQRSSHIIIDTPAKHPRQQQTALRHRTPLPNPQNGGSLVPHRPLRPSLKGPVTSAPLSTPPPPPAPPNFRGIGPPPPPPSSHAGQCSTPPEWLALASGRLWAERWARCSSLCRGGGGALSTPFVSVGAVGHRRPPSAPVTETDPTTHSRVPPPHPPAPRDVGFRGPNPRFCRFVCPAAVPRPVNGPLPPALGVVRVVLAPPPTPSKAVSRRGRLGQGNCLACPGVPIPPPPYWHGDTAGDPPWAHAPSPPVRLPHLPYPPPRGGGGGRS